MQNEAWLRIGFFVATLAIMMAWEAALPNRRSPIANSKRWLSNFFLVFCGTLVGRLLVPTGLAVVALFAQQGQIGLFNIINIGYWAPILIAVVLLDCLVYWQHRVLHRVPMLWRLHKVHHTDPHLDASTGLRFHPLEIALSLLVKALGILLLGAPLEAVLIFEILLNASSIFNHSNIKLPLKVELPLRQLIVTQAMHRIHHSQEVRETNSNFGFALSIWDKLFATYCHQAENGDEGIKLGLKEYPSKETNTGIITLLMIPFKSKPSNQDASSKKY